MVEMLDVGGHEVVLRLDGVENPAVVPWIRTAVGDVARWYGGLAARRLVIEVRGQPGHGVYGGRTWPGETPIVQVTVGNDTTDAERAADWVLVHELVHTAFPTVQARHHWIEEGLATYIEPFIRTSNGRISAELAWGELVRGVPQGQPLPGELGIDHTPTWARTYWGGALFCLVVDVNMRERTKGSPGLREGLVAVAHSGGMARPGLTPLPFLLSELDRPVGGSTALHTWRAWSDSPVTVDVAALWAWLGVSVSGEEVTLDDWAPGAWARHQIDGTPVVLEGRRGGR